jgi:hypothetical protein
LIFLAFVLASLLPWQPLRAADTDQLLVDLVMHSGGFNEKAFARGEYRHVRKAFATFFEVKHGEDLRARLGDDATPLFEFLNANPEIKETLLTAIDPEIDDPALVMAIFRDLWRTDPDAVKANDELAIAVAVVWDNPRGVYDHRGHQIRTRSILPDGVMKVDAMDNFR